MKNQMKKTATMLFIAAALLFSSHKIDAAEPTAPKIGVVNFKECVDRSKMGKQEQASFEALKKQAEQVMQQKEKTLQEISAKLNDPDYLDSLSPEAEAELKHKFRALSQELAQQQQQLYQTLSQANFKIIQKLTEQVNQAANSVAKEMNLDCVINEDACFFFSSKLDITSAIIKKMDDTFSKNEE